MSDISRMKQMLERSGYKVTKQGQLPVGKLAKGKSVEDIAKMHRYSAFLLRKNLEHGIKTEMEHTSDKEIAKAIALDHLYEDPEYYKKLKRIEKLGYGSIADTGVWYSEGGKTDKDSIEISHYIIQERERAEAVINALDPKISRFIVSKKLYDNAYEKHKLAKSQLEKLMWNEVMGIWDNAMDAIQKLSKSKESVGRTLLKPMQRLHDVFIYADGGLAYGNSHANGGIPLMNKATNSAIEIEGGEGVVNKRSMQMTKKINFEGEKLTACEIVSKINEMGGGVKFKCSDVKNIIEADGNFA